MANRLKTIREAQGWKRIELADRSGVSRTTIWRIEHGYDATDSILGALARVLRVKVEALRG